MDAFGTYSSNSPFVKPGHPITPPPSPEQTTKQTSETLPGEEEWQCYLVPAKDWESQKLGWAAVYPHIHCIRRTPDDKHYVVAIANSCVQELRKRRLRFEPGHKTVIEYRGSEFSVGEEKIQGRHTARQKYSRCFLQNAIWAISAGHGKGLGRLYHCTTLDEGLRTAIDWAIVTTEILSLDAKAFHEFLSRLQNLDPTRSVAPQFIRRDGQTWFDFFEDLRSRKTERPADDPKAEMHKISQFRRLYDESAIHDGPSILCDISHYDSTKPVTMSSLKR